MQNYIIRIYRHDPATSESVGVVDAVGENTVSHYFTHLDEIPRIITQCYKMQQNKGEEVEPKE